MSDILSLTITIRDVEKLRQDLRSVAVIFPARCKWSRKRGVYRWRKSRRYGFAGLLGWKDIEQRKIEFVEDTVTPWLERWETAQPDIRASDISRLISSSPKNEQSEG